MRLNTLAQEIVDQIFLCVVEAITCKPWEFSLSLFLLHWRGESLHWKKNKITVTREKKEKKTVRNRDHVGSRNCAAGQGKTEE